MDRSLLLLLLANLVFSGCEDAFTTVIDADPPPFTRKMVVHLYGDDVPGNPQSLTLETNRNIFDAQDQSLLIPDALVVVEENGVATDTFRWDPTPNSGMYSPSASHPFDQYGAEYTLRISAPGIPAVEARQTLPTPVHLSDALYVPDLAITEGGDRVDGFKATFADQPGAGDYYLLDVVDILNPDYRIYLESNDPFVQTTNDGLVLIHDEGNEGFDQTFEVYSYDVDPSTDYIMHLQHISKDLYQYLLSVDRYVNNDIDFFSEPVFVNTNVKNGLGIFSLASVTGLMVRK